MHFEQDRFASLAHKRLLIVEEGLKDYVGHWYEYVRSVVEINERRGATVEIAVHSQAQPEVVRGLNAHAIFARSNWDGVYAHPQSWRRYIGIIRHNILVYRTMSRFLKERAPFDCVFAPTVIIYHLVAWRLLLARHGGSRFHRLVLFLRNNAGSYPVGSSAPVFKSSAIILRLVLRSFGPHLRSRSVVLATDSDRLAGEYEKLCGIRPKLFPARQVSFPLSITGVCARQASR